jgi:phage shock protein E
MLELIKKIFRGNKTNFKSLVEKGAVIVDVRSNPEFRIVHIKGAVNIPVEQVKIKINDLKKMNKPVITCCKSGMRSGMAASILSSAGLEVYNGGAWNILQRKI